MEVKIGEVNNGVIPIKLAQMVDHVISVARENQIETGYWKEWYIQTSLYIYDKNALNGDKNGITTNNNMTPNDDKIDREWQKYDMNVSKMNKTRLSVDDINSTIFTFYIRVPFYFIEYSIDLQFQLLNNKLSKNELETFESASSQIYNIKIPSFLIEPRFEVGQSIVYVVPNAYFVWGGKILKIIHNDDDDNCSNSINDNKNDGVGGGGINIGGLDDAVNTPNDDNIDDIHFLGDNKDKEDAKHNDNGNENGNENETGASSSDVAIARRKESGFLGSNVRYLIEIDENQSHIDYSDKNNYIFTADHTQIYTDAISTNYVINIIDRKEIEFDFILRNKNIQIRQYYWDLRNMISNYYKKIYKDYIEYEKKKYWYLIHRYDFDLIGSLFSNILCEYLFDFDCDFKNDVINYKIRCFTNSSFNSDDGMVFIANHWSYMLRGSIDAIENGLKIDGDVQAFNTSGWNCDMCRCSIHINDWCFHCQKDSEHDYCINCTYSMANEIIKFEHYLQNIIHTYIDSQFTIDCIQVLVAFVCGYAKKSCQIKV